TESGSIFVQIGDENVHLVRNVLDEVLGAENQVATVTFRTTANLVGNYLGRNSDTLLWYAYSYPHLKFRKLYKRRTLVDDIGERYTRVELTEGARRPMSDAERADPATIPKTARPYTHGDLTSQGETGTGSMPIEHDGHVYSPGTGRHWT